MAEKIGLEGVFKTEAFSSGLKTYTSGLSSAIGATTSAAGSIVTGLGGAVLAGVAAFAALGVAAVAAGIAVAGAMSKIVFSSAAAADEIMTMSLKSSIGIERLQELAYAGKMLDFDLESVTTSLARMIRSMAGAVDGTGDAADAYKTLGIQLVDTNGHLRDSNSVFGEVIDALGKVENPAERDAMAMFIFGRSALELNPLIKAGSAELAKYSLEAHEMGAVVSTEGIVALDKFQDTWEALKLSGKGVMASFAMTFLPAFQQIEGFVGDFMRDIAKTKNLKELLVVGKTWMRKLSIGMTKGLPLLKKAIPKVIKQIADFLKAGLPEFIVFASTLISTIIKGIGAALPTLIPAAIGILLTLLKALKDNWPKIVEAGREVLNKLLEGLRAGWELLKDKLPTIGEILDWIFKTAVDLSAKFKAWVDKIDWKKLGEDISTSLSKIKWEKYGAQFSDMLRKLGAAIGHFASTFPWLEVGVSVAKSFADFWTGFFSELFFPTEGPKGFEDIGYGMSRQFEPPKTWETGVVQPWRKNIKALGDMVGEYDWEAVGKEAATQIASGLDLDWAHIKAEMLQGFPTDFWTLPTTGMWISFDTAMAILQTKCTTWWADKQEWWHTSWMNWFTEPFQALQIRMRQWGTDLVEAVKTGISNVWPSLVNLLIGLAIGLISALMPLLMPLLNLFGLGGSIKGTLKVPTENLKGNIRRESSMLGGGTNTGGGVVNNSIVVNNPSAEPASTSVSRELKRLSYLGVAA